MFGRRKKTGFEAHYHQIIDQIPTAIILCNEDFTVRYMNAASRQLLMKLLPNLWPNARINADLVYGFNFDKITPELRKLWSARPANSSPNHPLTIAIAGKSFDIMIGKSKNTDNYNDALLTITLQAQTETSPAHDNIDLYGLLDNLPHNVMFSDTSGKIMFVSKSGLETFRREQKHLPIPADKIIGANFDVFHKNPQRIREIVENKSHFLHRTKIHLGEQIFDFRATPLNDRAGKRMGTIVTWSSFTFASDFVKKMKALIDSLTESTNKFQEVAQSLASGAEETSQQTRQVAQASEELKQSVNNIAKQISDASQMVRNAVDEAMRSEKMVSSLIDAADKIGSVSQVVASIAGQTNLLALNATIEAARAGEAGRGFAVVASEVKSLANQTANATDEIGLQVKGIQESSQSTARGIHGIAETITKVSGITLQVAASIEQQSNATSEVSRNILSVREAAEGTGRLSTDLLKITSNLKKSADDLENEIDNFMRHL